MMVDLNTASGPKLLQTGLTPAEVRKIKQFRKDNAVFHTKEDLKKHCGFSRAQYEEIKDQLTTHRLQDSPYYQEVRPTEYRRQRGDIKDNWDVAHIIARANGGADHPANYVPMSRPYNRRLENLHDGVIFALISDEMVREAVRASRVQRRCPLTFSKAMQLKKDALDNKEELIREGQGQVDVESTVNSSSENGLSMTVAENRTLSLYEDV